MKFNGRKVIKNSFYSSGKKSEGKLLQHCKTHLHLGNSMPGPINVNDIDHESNSAL